MNTEKKINTSNWMDKLVWLTFAHELETGPVNIWMPKTTCGFYFYLALAILLLPFTGIFFYFRICLEKKHSYEKEKDLFLGREPWPFAFGYILMLIVSFLITTSILMHSSKNEMTTTQMLWLAVISVFTLYIYTFIVCNTFIFIAKIYDKLKDKFCRPVTYKNNKEIK